MSPLRNMKSVLSLIPPPISVPSFQLVRLEIADHASMPLLAVKLLSQYFSSQEVRDVILSQLMEWMSDPMTSSNPFVALIAATIYANEGNHVEALKACHNASSLEAMALSTQIYLQMHRTDKAEQQVKVWFEFYMVFQVCFRLCQRSMMMQPLLN